MSALHRNALLDEEDQCLKCGEKVELPADYCAKCVCEFCRQNAASFNGSCLDCIEASVRIMRALLPPRGEAA